MGKVGSYDGVRALPLITLALALAGCGGGSSGDVSRATVQSAGNSTSCPETGMQCSGDSILRVENGIAVTTSGVQTYAISTNDLLQPNPSPATAYGLQPATGGLADVRIKRDSGGQTTGVTMLLSKLGISWDGKTERPLIIETDRKSTRLNSSHVKRSRMPSSA